MFLSSARIPNYTIQQNLQTVGVSNQENGMHFLFPYRRCNKYMMYIIEKTRKNFNIKKVGILLQQNIYVLFISHKDSILSAFSVQ